MIIFILLISRHGKTRLNKFYIPFNQRERHTIQRDVSCPPLTTQVSSMIIGRSSRLTHFLEWRDYKIVFKRYLSSSYYQICITLLRSRHRKGRQRADCAGYHPPFRRSPWPLLRQRLRAWLDLQLSLGVLYPWGDDHRRSHHGEQQEVDLEDGGAQWQHDGRSFF